jgi:hypothetical protein
MEVFLCYGVQCLLHFRLNVLNCMKSSPLQLDFHLAGKKEVGWIQCQPTIESLGLLEAVIEVPCRLPSDAAYVHSAAVVAQSSQKSRA